MDSLKTLLVTALRDTFSDTYPIEEWQNLYVSVEYPISKAAYPGVWVDFEPIKEITTVGVASVFYTTQPPYAPYLLWQYNGISTFTITALTSWQRDRLFDQLTRVFAFGKVYAANSTFRSTIVENPYIACNMDWDTIQIMGAPVATPHTPWDSEEIIYEVTMGMKTWGEFASDPANDSLLLLSAVDFDPSIDLSDVVFDPYDPSIDNDYRGNVDPSFVPLP